MTTAERVGTSIRQWRQLRRLTQEQLGEKIGSDGPRVGRLEKGNENPTLETLDKLAIALEIDVSSLLTPRPESDLGRANEGQQAAGHPILETLIATLDVEMPADESWQGDVLKAIGVLNRALRRSDTQAIDAAIGKARR